jgi:hypothetical protein
MVSLVAAPLFPAGGCWLVKGKASPLIARMETALHATAAPPCASWNALTITGDAVADYAKIQQFVKQGDVVAAIGTDAARACSGLKGMRLMGLLIPNAPEFAKTMQVISLYPDPQVLFPYLKQHGYSSLLLLHAGDSAERAFLLAMAGRQAGVDIKPVSVESPLDIPTKLRKGLEGVQAAVLSVDPKFFDEAFLKLVMEEVRRSGKPVFCFLRIFLDYGADAAFIVEEEDMAREVLAKLAEPRENGLVQVGTAHVKRGKTTKGDWKDEKLAR